MKDIRWHSANEAEKKLNPTISCLVKLEHKENSRTIIYDVGYYVPDEIRDQMNENPKFYGPNIDGWGLRMWQAEYARAATDEVKEAVLEKMNRWRVTHYAVLG